MPTKKTMGITAGALAAIALAGGGGYYALTGGSSQGIAIASTDIATVAAKDLTTTVSASGTVAAEREVALTTSLTGAVSELNAKVGQRVQAGQKLAHIDTSATQRELDAQRASQAAEQVSGMNQVEAAQLQLTQLQDALDKGLNAEVNAARAAVATAQGAYDDAQRAADDAARAAVNRGSDDPAVREAASAVATARSGLRTANSQSVQAALAALKPVSDAALGAVTGSESTGSADSADQASAAANALPTASGIVNWVETDAGRGDAARRLTEAEEAYNHALAEIDRAAADKQRAAAGSFRQLADAEVSQAAAELAAQNQIATQSQAVDHALKSAAGASVSAEQANATLSVELGQADVTSPLAGVVTAVGATQGQPAQGPIVTVADDSSVLLKATVKEADLAGLKKGDKVTFTSPSQPGKEYTGTVEFISPVAAAPAASGDGANTAASAPSAKAEFPVEIRVTGNRDGLRLGSTAKAKIVTDSQKGVLTVPLSALIDNRQVLVLADGRIASRDVTVGTTSDFEAAITEGLKDGDQVITQPDQYKELIGQQAFVQEGSA